MLADLLAERFAPAVQTDQKIGPAYALVLGKMTPKIPAAAAKDFAPSTVDLSRPMVLSENARKLLLRRFGNRGR
jgi:uncharacterized protein (TIGR03435 family)